MGEISRIDLYRLYQKQYAENQAYGRPLRCHKLFLNMVPMIRDAGVESILEISCGRGVVCRALKKHGFHVTVTESSRWLVEHDLANEECFPYFAHDLEEIESESFDLCFSINVADHVTESDMASLVKNSMRIAKKMCVLVVNGDPRFQTLKRTVSQWLHMTRAAEPGVTIDFRSDEGGDIIVARRLACSSSM